MAWFLIIKDTNGERGLVLNSATAYNLGRTSSADICLANTFVSGQHARLEPLADHLGFLLIDTQSRNGSYSPQGKAIKTMRLREGEPVYLGSPQTSITLTRTDALPGHRLVALVNQAVPIPKVQPTRLFNQPAHQPSVQPAA